ncbi:Bgt-51305 [Blumeria graminis f. sp. tritici]|uniref:Bgt-51305 n=1 Tax=Blumeria graminis f. sp. tritici TaxID=62690 RepID=A0A9X9QBX1_BLUGR|nr:Bgt-51305 [Blumeria graminis f. sp. tritici]
MMVHLLLQMPLLIMGIYFVHLENLLFKMSIMDNNYSQLMLEMVIL